MLSNVSLDLLFFRANRNPRSRDLEIMRANSVMWIKYLIYENCGYLSFFFFFSHVV
jgi:hypothetical protein